MVSSTSGHVLSTAMHRRIEHIAAELLICRSPASISNYIFSAVFTYFLGGFLRKKRWLLGLRPRPRWGSLQRSPTPPSSSRTLPGAAPPTTSPHPLPHPRRCPPPPSQFLDPPLWGVAVWWVWAGVIELSHRMRLGLHRIPCCTLQINRRSTLHRL